MMKARKAKVGATSSPPKWCTRITPLRIHLRMHLDDVLPIGRIERCLVRLGSLMRSLRSRLRIAQVLGEAVGGIEHCKDFRLGYV
jgi:hypothetical protein